VQKKIARNEEVTEDMRQTVAYDSDDEVSVQDSDYSEDEESDTGSLGMEDELDLEDILEKKKEQKYVDGSRINF
jgi:hypothetical protein